MILEIASNTTPCSRACLALTSKTLLSVISGGFSTLFNDLRLPAEFPEGNPPFFVANDWPSIYQPERWEFLCLLQKDSRQWLACSDCFVLHPAQWFGQIEVAVWPLNFSWPQCRPPNLKHLSRDRVARGIVELCPCVKLTPSKKRTLLADLQRRSQEQESRGLRGIETCSAPNNGPWWHECRAVYRTGVVETKIHPYLLVNGELGVVTEYTYNRNLGMISPLLRLACPHCYLGSWRMSVCDLANQHRCEASCGRCLQGRQCRYCSTRVLWATTPELLDSSYLSTISTERDLSDKFWKNQVIFPFPRYTKVLYPKSIGCPPGSTIEQAYPWYKRWYLYIRRLL